MRSFDVIIHMLSKPLLNNTGIRDDTENVIEKLNSLSISSKFKIQELRLPCLHLTVPILVLVPTLVRCESWISCLSRALPPSLSLTMYSPVTHYVFACHSLCISSVLSRGKDGSTDGSWSGNDMSVTNDMGGFQMTIIMR